MSVLNKTSFFQNRRDAVPDQELAKELAETKTRMESQKLQEKV